MSTASPDANPLDALVLLQETLAAQGVIAHPWALSEACGGSLTLKAFARCAVEQGLEASLTRLEPGDLAFVGVGSLVAFADGALAKVVASGPVEVVLAEADGTRVHVGRRTARQPVSALAIGPATGARAKTKLLARIARAFAAERHGARAVLLATLLAAAVLALGLASAMLTRAALGSALPDRAPSTLRVLAVGVALVGLQLAYVGWLRRRALRFVTTKLAERASVEVVGHMLRLPFARLAKLEVGVATQAATSAGAAAEALPTLFPQLLDAVLGVGYLAYTFTLDEASGLLAAGAGLCVVVTGAAMGYRELGLRRALLARSRKAQQRLYETLAGIETVKTEAIEGRAVARWLDLLVQEQGAALALRVQTSTAATVLAAFDTLVFGGVLLLGARRCLAGGASVADLTAAAQATACFMASAQALARVPALLARLRGDLERADDVLTEEAETASAPARAEGHHLPALVLRDVWFRYDEQAPWVLEGVDLVIRAGETVVLAWPSGAGKSTLLRVLSGLLAPARGDALVFGVEASRARQMVTYIPQQATLFPGSILENLQILSRSSDMRRVLAAAHATGLADMVASWGMGMDTVLSAGGTNVSTGQRQLVLLTAAVASEAPIVLLDEALAHLDRALRTRLSGPGLFAGKTVFAVTHDAAPDELSGARVVPLGAREGRITPRFGEPLIHAS